MNEDFLHYLWKHKKFNFSSLRTTDHKEVVIKKVGDHNTANSGPDFFNAQLVVDDQLWAGTVEIHKKSSDWYVHNHENNPAYDNVILHVVWEDDVEIFRKDNTRIPSLELKNYIDKGMERQYTELFEKKRRNWIQCESRIGEVPEFVFSNWKERLFLERLEDKSKMIQDLLNRSQNDWEGVLFRLLFKNFGSKVNGEAFLSLADSIDFSIIRKCKENAKELEALFMGQAGLLNEFSAVTYEKELFKQYMYLKHKFQLKTDGVLPVQFFRLRPSSFPTIRLSQLSQMYANRNNLFQEIITNTSTQGFYDMFSVGTSTFWKTHYTFDKDSVIKNKTITEEFVNLLIINTIIPVKFLYARSIGKSAEDEIISLIGQLPPEKNSIIKKFSDLDVVSDHALHSQAMLQLKNQYCDRKACLQCAVGNYLLNSI